MGKARNLRPLTWMVGKASPEIELGNKLDDLLVRRRSQILKRWVGLVFDSYPAQTSTFLRSKKNRIANPVGASIQDGADKLYDWLVGGEASDVESIRLPLDNIVRIRAVQEFSAAHSMGFVFSLKTAVREILREDIRREHLFEELLAFEDKIDAFALLAFDNYSRCREQLHQIRATEIRNRTSRILERVCQKYGMPSEWEDPE